MYSIAGLVRDCFGACYGYLHSSSKKILVSFSVFIDEPKSKSLLDRDLRAPASCQVWPKLDQNLNQNLNPPIEQKEKARIHEEKFLKTRLKINIHGKEKRTNG